MHYPAISRCNQEPVPFLGGYCEYLGQQLGVPLTLKVNRPCLYLSDDEKGWIDQIRQHFTDGRPVPFRLVCAGVKPDYTAKAWPIEFYQEVVDRSRGRIQWPRLGSQYGFRKAFFRIMPRTLARMYWNRLPF